MSGGRAGTGRGRRLATSRRPAGAGGASRVAPRGADDRDQRSVDAVPRSRAGAADASAHRRCGGRAGTCARSSIRCASSIAWNGASPRIDRGRCRSGSSSAAGWSGRSTRDAGPWLPLGADRLGRDGWARLVVGARRSLGVAFTASPARSHSGSSSASSPATPAAPSTALAMRAAELVLVLPVLYVVLAARRRPADTMSAVARSSR